MKYKLLYWTPRILTIIFIIFLSLFSLDIFGNNYTFWETVLGLFMHNIPSLVLLVLLIFAWKREWIGAVAFVLAGLLYIVFLLITSIKTGFEWYYLAWTIQISGFAFVIAYLWHLNWKNKTKRKKKPKKRKSKKKRK